MDCMKCGRDTGGKQVFCPECLETMHRYPVKKDAVVHIPNRDAINAERQPPHRDTSARETIRHQRSVIRFLALGMAFLAILLCVTAGMLLFTLQKPSPEDSVIPHANTTQLP